MDHYPDIYRDGKADKKGSKSEDQPLTIAFVAFG